MRNKEDYNAKRRKIIFAKKGAEIIEGTYEQIACALGCCYWTVVQARLSNASWHGWTFGLAKEYVWRCYSKETNELLAEATSEWQMSKQMNYAQSFGQKVLRVGHKNYRVEVSQEKTAEYVKAIEEANYEKERGYQDREA